jgi:hypothetical protein
MTPGVIFHLSPRHCLIVDANDRTTMEGEAGMFDIFGWQPRHEYSQNI